MWESLGIKNEHTYTSKLAIQSKKKYWSAKLERIQFIDSKVLGEKS